MTTGPTSPTSGPPRPYAASPSGSTRPPTPQRPWNTSPWTGSPTPGPRDPRTVAVAEGLRRGRSVAATAAEAGLGARQLHRRSLAAFGYGPKTLARILRLQRALELIRTGLPYAEAACTAGCTDQAHLAREMRDLAGTTLGAYFGAGDADANSETPQPSGSSTTA
ncbi:hypothetical protein GCM10010298_39240 [Streptomyces microflavus]|uniref:HTH araC/xylS-type domain-containing protein n=1 Tax=Streptomyces microflavus TaxID=1919 RepID=A0A7J0D093_STRMI|nr:hypothetical protein Smic_66990 [Streptomyces microflavus]GGX70653.1 hypothetical protein GCM10010298_39240 [Streptomyces microflavus]